MTTSLYFSPTYTTRTVVETIAKSINNTLEAAGKSTGGFKSINVTTPMMRRDSPSFTQDDIVVFGVPVYIGRVPNLIRDYFASIQGNGAIGIPVVVYGNRAYDDALLELKDIMHSNGFRCISAAAFNNTAYFPSTVSPQDSLTLVNSSSSQFTLTAMAIASLMVPFVVAYIAYCWKKLGNTVSK